MSTLKVGTIQDHTNSNTAISIDSSGRVTQPAKPAFVQQDGTQQCLQVELLPILTNKCW